jgi:L-seryl-tRNA(Ser) seleniumtransferase
VHAVLAEAERTGLVARHGRGPVTVAVRAALAEMRAALRGGRAEALEKGVPGVAAVAIRAAEALARDDRPRLVRAVNATGIVLHTGLGRAAMPEEARRALAEVAGHCNLQIDLEEGTRDRREHALRDLARELTGGEDVLVVNNTAAATLLVLRALASGREVVVSRGELIEIGGSFRLPDVMTESGAVLREVGTTNRTHLRDYARAVCSETGLLLKVHKSNFAVLGFTREVGIAELAELGRQHGIPAVDDLGSGALVPLERYGLAHEMTLRESLDAGADLVLASTDKLIGGPQGGMIVGRQDLIERIRNHALYRAMRVCKLTLAALEATLRLFRAPDQLGRRHPVYRALAKSVEEAATQSEALAAQIRALDPPWSVEVVPHEAFLGGGSLPGQSLPSYAVRLRPRDGGAADLARRLRQAAVPVIPRVHADAVLLDGRTMEDAERAGVEAACRAALTAASGAGDAEARR